ncbi:hypothetical protein [Amycolatopsis sp. lyj-23]|uniref:hypothetical protein n=1 Tax=Amycolatopsis sp. lyj-23 TaxID=2789283 RepID=UPI00397D6C75
MSLDPGDDTLPAGHADDHSTVEETTVAGIRSTRVVIDFAADGPTLRRIQIVDVHFPRAAPTRHGRRRMHRWPRTWPEVAGMIVGNWATTLRAGVIVMTVAASGTVSPSGLGAASTAMTGALCALTVRRLRAGGTTTVPQQLP